MIPFFQVTKMESRVFVPPDEIHAHKQYALNCEVHLRNPRIFTASTPFGEKQVLRVDFAYSVNYLNPSVGQLRFEGITDYFGNVDYEGIIKQWDSGNSNPEVRNEIANHMLHNLAPVALILSRALGLPPSIPIPQIDFTAQKAGEANEAQGMYG